jgi:pimeloyl-ACP methyl ester carboxylesterase
MTRAVLPTGIELEYDTFGSSDDPTTLLVMGLGGQMIAWDEAWCNRLAAFGRYIVRFDNRDSGLSTKIDGGTFDMSAIAAAVLTGADIPPVPYDLSDMAADSVGLLDHLGVEAAHIVGVSLGGMIGQTMAIEYPKRTLSLISIMSSIGDPEYGRPSAATLTALLVPPPTTRDEIMDAAEAWAKATGSKRYLDVRLARERAGIFYDRSHYPNGVGRQLAAGAASGDRTDRLRKLTVPTLVIHGQDDRLFDISGGRRTAEVIPGANLLELADMGHDVPFALWSIVINSIVAHQDLAVRAENSEVAV